MQQYFPCHRCGAHNLVGAPSCSHCQQQLYYSCPHCRAWVDNRYSHCPQCHKAMNWPQNTVPQYTYGQTWYVPQAGFTEKKKGNPLPAILVSLFVIGVVALIFINPGSSSATKSGVTADPVQTTRSSISPSGSQPQITISGPAAPSDSASKPATSLSTQASSGGSSAYMPAGVTLTTTSGEIIEIPVTPSTSTSSSGSSTVKRSAYLDQLWPTWGHCTKGSCQAYTQQ
jgi:hypothetical protein